MKQEIKKLKIGEVGILPVELPVICLGKGRPKGLIIATQHGGEYSGLFVIKKLLRKLQNLNGSLLILPVANPFGQIFGQRNETIDNKNLNRLFPGNKDNDFSQRLAVAIFSIANGADFVIDLHNFTGRISPFIGILVIAKKRTAGKSKEMARTLGPDLIWQINLKLKGDRGFAGALSTELIKKGIPTLSIEMPPLTFLKARQLGRIVKGILAVLALFKMIKPSKRQNKINKIPVFTIKTFYADQSGLFEPFEKPLSRIKKGQKIGLITSVIDFSEKQIASPINGQLISIKNKDFIRTGNKIFSIGKQIGEL